MNLLSITTRIKKYGKVLPMLLVLLVLSKCVDIIGNIEQPESVPAGDTFTAVMHVNIPASDAGKGTRLVAALLAPKEWGASANMEVTYKIVSSSRPLGSGGSMSLVPQGTFAPGSTLDYPSKIANVLGANTYGANKIKTLDWIVFWSNETYDIVNGDKVQVDVTFKVKTGDRNVNVELGYFAANSTYSWDPSASNHAFDYRFVHLETTGGLEPVMDYLEPQLSVVEPFSSTDNDLVTFSFDGTVDDENTLTGLDQVYMCASAYTHDGQVITVCGNNEENKMTSDATDRWSLTMWPKGYFNVSDNQVIDSVKYYFSDASGSKIVQHKSSNSPFLYKFSCD